MAKTSKIPYGVKNFKHIRTESCYYVGKTACVRRMVCAFQGVKLNTLKEIVRERM